jgi:hypothetical protein
MEKTNRCATKFICYDSMCDCKYFEAVDLLDYQYRVCRFEADGDCTNETAIKEAKDGI